MMSQINQNKLSDQKDNNNIITSNSNINSQSANIQNPQLNQMLNMNTGINNLNKNSNIPNNMNQCKIINIFFL